MIHTVQGFILRRREITESSLVLTVFTDRSGKLSFLAKGARRKKSPFLGRVELFSLCHFTYYESRRKGLNVLSECEIISPFAGLRENFSHFLSACSLARLVDMGTGSAHQVRGVFDILKEVLVSLPTFPDPDLLKRYFELHLLSLLGYSIRWNSCVRCGRDGLRLRAFSASAGGMVCASCAGRHRDTIAVSPGARAILNSLESSTVSLISRIDVDPAQAIEVEAILQRALAFYLECNPRLPLRTASAF
ncbi:MAG: DNA repair protein RecO [Candidatus Aureabacteria bacterium]|nr:DNA repair protein RecO [Candidatus Auribacterota bacterium]